MLASSRGGFLIMYFIVMAIPFILLIAAFITTKFERRECVETKVVTIVGGCERNGDCGVQYADGTFGVLRLPVVGKTVCTKEVATWSWK